VTLDDLEDDGFPELEVTEPLLVARDEVGLREVVDATELLPVDIVLPLEVPVLVIVDVAVCFDVLEILEDDEAVLVTEELVLAELDLDAVEEAREVVVLPIEDVVALTEVVDALDETDAVLELALPLELEESFVDVPVCVVDETARVLVVTLLDVTAEELDEGLDRVDVLLIVDERDVFPVEATVVDEGLDTVEVVLIVDETDDLIVDVAELLVFTEEMAVDFELAEGELVEEATDERVDFAVVLALPLEVTPLEVLADLLLWTGLEVVLEDCGTLEVLTTMLDDFNTETVVVGLDVATLLVALEVVIGLVEDNAVVLCLVLETKLELDLLPVLVDEMIDPEDLEDRLVVFEARELVVGLLAVLEDLMIEVENPWLVVDLVEIFDEVGVTVEILLEEVIAVLVLDNEAEDDDLMVETVCDEVLDAEGVFVLFELDTGAVVPETDLLLVD
jgi:hypothetical protein